MTEYNQRERARALEYIQGRGKWVLANKFTPTKSYNTDIKHTMHDSVTEAFLAGDGQGMKRGCLK